MRRECTPAHQAFKGETQLLQPHVDEVGVWKLETTLNISAGTNFGLGRVEMREWCVRGSPSRSIALHPGRAASYLVFDHHPLPRFPVGLPLLVEEVQYRSRGSVLRLTDIIDARPTTTVKALRRLRSALYAGAKLDL